MIKITRDVVIYAAKYISGRTLDLGAGNAKYAGIIRPYSSGYLTYDIASKPNIDIIGDILNINLPDSSFDTVISTQVLEHVSKPWVMVGQIRRILKPGGICILSAPFLVPFHADPHDYFRFTKEGMTSLFEGENFEIIECESYGRTWSVISEFVHFSWFNPYLEQVSWAHFWRKVFPLLQRLFLVLDKLSKNQIIYTNVYIIARKR